MNYKWAIFNSFLWDTVRISWNMMGYHRIYPLVNVNKKLMGTIHHAIKFGKSTMSMGHFQ